MKFLFFTALVFIAIILAKSLKIKDTQWQPQPFNTTNTLPLRGILALLIVLHHFFVSMPSGWPPSDFFVYLGAMVVGMFFFISGYGLTISYLNKGKNYLSGFWNKRVKKIIIPLLVTIAVYELANKHYNLLNVFNGLKNGQTPTPFTWFVYTIIIYYAVYYISFKFFKIKTALAIMLIFTAIYEYVIINLNWDSCWYSATFAINVGMYYAYYEEKIKSYLIKHTLSSVIALSTFIALFFLYAIINGKKQLGLPFGDFVLFWIMPLLIVFTIYFYGFKTNKLLNFVGNISYEIYIVHGIFVIFLQKYINNPLLYLIAIYATTITVAWLLNISTNKLFQLPKKA